MDYASTVSRVINVTSSCTKEKTSLFLCQTPEKLKTGKKHVLPKHNSVVKKFASLAIRNKLRQYRPEIVLQEFLARCVVDTSLKMGLPRTPNHFSIASDGTPFYSGASHYGVKVCDCKSKGVFDCKCPRRYSDPDATWGWDSYREQWFYGDNLFVTTASDSPYGRTIYIKPDYDPRLFPSVHRDSDAFKDMLKRRTTVERSHKRMFKGYDIEAGNCRSSKERFTRAIIAAVNIHLDAWIKHTGFSINNLLNNDAGSAA